MRRLLQGLLILSLVGLPGCWDRVEIDDLAIAIAAAVDLTPDNKIQFSEQVYVPGPTPSGSDNMPGGGGQHYFVFTGTGEDIRAAHLELQKQLSRRLFIADRNLYLISDKAARHGIRPLIDELVRNPQSRMRTHVAVTEGDAVNYLKVKYPFEQTPGAALRKLLFGASSNFMLDLNHLARVLQKPGQYVLTPLVTLQPTSPQAEDTFKIAGICVFKKGKMIGSLPPDLSKGVLWMRNQMRFDTPTTKIPGHRGHITTSLLRAHTDYDVQIKNGHPAIRMQIVAEEDVIENDTDLNLTHPANLNLLQRSMSAKKKHDIEQALDQLQHRYNSDIIGIGELVHRAKPQLWNATLKKNWDQEFAKLPVEVVIDEKIRRIGMTGESLTRPRRQP